MIVVITLSPRDYDAVLFDLDGVLTRTASVHAAAWKKLFDSFLEQRATQAGEPFVPFDIDTDYPRVPIERGGTGWRKCSRLTFRLSRGTAGV